MKSYGKLSINLLVIPLVLIGGIILIYFVASKLLNSGQTYSEDMIVGQEEQNATGTKDYSAPDFELGNIRGEKVKLSDFKDKIIILNFWASWNQPAQDQLVVLDSYYQEINNKDYLSLITVNNLEDNSVVSNFIRRGGYILPVLLDSDGKIGELYKIDTLPATFFIDRSGKIREVFVGILSKGEITSRVESLYGE
jgi:peroxiredoxin